jgi:hypothetical protein
MEPEDSVPCSQEPSTGTYPQKGQFNPYHLILPLHDPSYIIQPLMSWSS